MVPRPVVFGRKVWTRAVRSFARYEDCNIERWLTTCTDTLALREILAWIEA